MARALLQMVCFCHDFLWTSKRSAKISVTGATDVTPQLIMDSYTPLHDTAALKAAPHLFETLRNNYCLREEV